MRSSDDKILSRIEATLERIEAKLDGKAESSSHRALDRRVQKLELAVARIAETA